MKAQLTVVNSYQITINGVTHAGFEKVSEWEGMAKFINQQGVVIAYLGRPSFADSVLENIFGKEQLGDNDIEVLMVSPSLTERSKR